MISFLKRSQKTRVSNATSREGGVAVGINSCAGLGKSCERSSYATRRFLAQVWQSRIGHHSMRLDQVPLRVIMRATRFFPAIHSYL